jgi:hypothetical protein
MTTDAQLMQLVRAYLGALDDLEADPCGHDALIRMNRRDDLLHALYVASGVPCHCTPDDDIRAATVDVTETQERL